MRGAGEPALLLGQQLLLRQAQERVLQRVVSALPDGRFSLPDGILFALPAGRFSNVVMPVHVIAT